MSNNDDSVNNGVTMERTLLAADALTLAHSRSLTKRKRVVLSIHDKQQVLQLLENGEQPIAIAREFGISRQQVSDIKKNKERILAYCVNAKCMSKLKCKTIKSVPEHHPGVEQELYRWIIRQRTLGRKVSAGSLTAKMVDLFMQYAADTSKMPFAAMTKWLKHFKSVYGLKVLSEDEMQQLPEVFVPTMGVIQTHSPERKEAASMDMNMCMHLMDHDNTRQAQDGASMTSLHTFVGTIQQLNTQFARFEHDMVIKLNEIDERVSKLCYFVLPSAKLR